MRKQTVGDLRKAIEGLPDDMLLGVAYDRGAEVCNGGGYVREFEQSEWIDDLPVFWLCED